MSDDTLKDPLPELPDLLSLVPRMMTASELQKNLETLFEWLHVVEASSDPAVSAGKRSVETVRKVANELLEERRERHSDETGFRGG